MNATANFLALLEQDARGHTWELSVRFGLHSAHCTTSTAKAFIAAAASSFEGAVAAGHVATPDLAWKCIELEKAKTGLTSTRPQLGPLAAPEEVTHVTTLDVTRLHHFPVLSQALSSTTAFSPATDSGSRREIVERVVDALVSAKSLVPAPGQQVGLRRVWITTGDSFTGINVKARATAVRDMRGLIHYGVSDFLIGYRLNPGSIPYTVRPTALDGVGTRFRAWSDTGANEPRGTTVDLRKFADGIADLDGVAECVTPPLPLTAELVIEVLSLGNPTDARGKAPGGTDNDAAFSARLMRDVASKPLFPMPPFGELIK